MAQPPCGPRLRPCAPGMGHSAARPSPGGGRVDPPAAMRAGRARERVEPKSDLRRWARRLATPQVVSKGSWVGGLEGQEATAVMSATRRQRQLRRAAYPTAHSSALASPDRRPLSAAVGWWWCARVAASGGGGGHQARAGARCGSALRGLEGCLVARRCGAVPLGGAVVQQGLLRGLVGFNPQAATRSGGGSGQGPSKTCPELIDLAASPAAGGGQGGLT